MFNPTATTDTIEKIKIALDGNPGISTGSPASGIPGPTPT